MATEILAKNEDETIFTPPNQITVLGSTHMDFVVYLKEFPAPGETITGESFATTPGGKGANQAVAIARLGARSHLISRVGEDFIGGTLLENLRKERVLTEHVSRDPRDSSGVALIYVNYLGENMIAVAPGVDHLVRPLDVEAAESMINGSKVMLAQLEVPLEAVEYAMRLGKKKRKITILNPAPAVSLGSEILEFVDMLTPNRAELATLTGRSTATDKDTVDSAQSLIDKGVKHVLVTLGARGALIVAESGHLTVPSNKVEVVDTVGAGDAFNGALAVALSAGEKAIEAVRFANLVAALKVTMRGAQTGLPTLKQVIEFSEARHLAGIPRSLLSR